MELNLQLLEKLELGSELLEIFGIVDQGFLEAIEQRQMAGAGDGAEFTTLIEP